ncbi:MAG: hypothetical protein QE272_12785 [Nevskia sp.]|nr:hypothetical protein [Nevskia sp.]
MRILLLLFALLISSCSATYYQKQIKEVQKDLAHLEVSESLTEVYYPAGTPDANAQASIDIRKFETPCTVNFDAMMEKLSTRVNSQTSDLEKFLAAIKQYRPAVLEAVATFEKCAAKLGFSATQTLRTKQGRVTYGDYTAKGLHIAERVAQVQDSAEASESARATLQSIVCTLAGAGTVSVRGYYRRDGTYVRPHTRSAPNHAGGC